VVYNLVVPLVPSYVADLEPYVTGRSVAEVCERYGLKHAIKLASNENPLGASPKAVRAILQLLESQPNRLAVYPTGGSVLSEVLAAHFGVHRRNVITGSGSEGIMSNIVRTFLCDGDEVLTADVTFFGFRVLAQSRGVAYRTVPLRNWRFDLEAIADAVNQRTKIIYLANPNNPTGDIFTRAEFDAFYRRIPERVLIILDEAYCEYARGNPQYPDSLTYRYDNVITLRTFSKAYGLAGMRIGYGFAHEDLISNLAKIKLPFEPSALAETAGVAALDDSEFLADTLRNNARGMEQLVRDLDLLGVRYVRSHANFVMTLWPAADVAAEITEGLLRQGLIVRPLAPFGVPNGIRITIGTPENNALLTAALSRVMKECLVCS
jgi:histidinol-phosphate aminotransferase